MPVTFPALTEVEGRLEAKRTELHNIFTQARAGGEGTLDLSKVEGFGGDQSAVAAKIRELNDELTDLGVEAEDLRAVQRAAESVDTGRGEPGDGARPAGANRTKPLARLIEESAAVTGKPKGGSVGPEAMLDVSVRDFIRPRATLFETGAGWAPESTRTGVVVDAATRPIQVLDLFPTTEHGQAQVLYMEETTRTHSAAEVAEGGQFAEDAFVLTERSETVRKIASFVPVTDEQLEDVPGAGDYLERRGQFGLRQRLDRQVLVGDGTAPNLSGVLDRAGIQTQARGVDPSMDAIYKGIVKVRKTGRAVPGAVVLDDDNFTPIRLLRTADGIYIWGSPNEAGPMRIWGLQIVIADEVDAITANSGLVGDFANFTELKVRRGVEVKISDSHSDFFIKGKQAMRFSIRAALCVYRPAAFCEITGLEA